MDKKAGFISIIGKPNVGKSTLLNSILLEKISIVTNKPQTTRNQVKGIYTKENIQMVFVDTPGIHNSKSKISKEMNRLSITSLKDVDMILFIIEAHKAIDSEDEYIISELKRRSDIPIIVIISKIDLTTKENLSKKIKEISTLLPSFKEIIPINGKKIKEAELIVKKTEKYLPIHPFYFNEDMSTDRDNKFLISELIREKCLKHLYQEVPHSIFVEVHKLEDDLKKNIIHVYANVYVERQSQKKVIIGKQGEMIKKISIDIRKEMEISYDAKVYIELFVKVKEKWRNDIDFIKKNGVIN